jgi:uncharacterized repeat protein (TIGR03803 family)
MTNTQGNRGWAAVIVAAILTMLAAAIAARAQIFFTLYDFDTKDGVEPTAALVQATDGYLYGSTSGGAGYLGTIFKIAPTGKLTTLYSFTPDQAPFEAMAQGADGNFYGTTPYGGAYDVGTIFKLTPAGTLTTLYSFCAQSGCTDGIYPNGELIQANDGSFYGTTNSYGANGFGGTIFKVTTSGALTTLYSFCSQPNCTDGNGPTAGLVQATDGNFYGTTSAGGDGAGTVFKITPTGTLTTLHSLGGNDGANPNTRLVQASDGSLYGTTQFGGSINNTCLFGNVGCGTVFRITPSGTMSTLHAFCSQNDCPDGGLPEGGLVEATDGNFYGTTEQGVVKTPYGTVFKITPGGVLTTLHRFASTDGAYPLGGLVQDTNGTFYGTTSEGGQSQYCISYGCGTVFAFKVGLGPFVETQPTFGAAGKVTKILGTNLTGATSVTFNGTPAVFKVISPSLIGATVPTGATTGPVAVVTPSGTLTSNVNFRVEP